MLRFLIGFTGVLMSTCSSRTICAQTADDELIFFTPPGFVKAGIPVTAGTEATGFLEIEVRNRETSAITACRINVIGPDGNYYQPASRHRSQFDMTGQWPKENAWGNRPGKAPYRYLGHFFYSTGKESIRVPSGRIRIEVWKGVEFHPEIAFVDVLENKTSTASIVIERTVPMVEFGYFGGDPHLHFTRMTERDEDTILELMDAEDVWYGTPLGYNEPAGPYNGLMEKMASPQIRLGFDSNRSRDHLSIMSGQEYRSAFFGHLNLYGLPDLVFEGKSFHLDNDGPAYGVVGAKAISEGGYAIHAHGGYSKEIYVDAALGAVSAVELLQFGIYRELGLTGWYDMLNTGYRFPCVGASDFPACRFMSDCRTYVRPKKPSNEKTAGNNFHTFGEWLSGMAEGRSFVTSAPLLLIDVDGHEPGDVIQQIDDKHEYQVRVRVRSEVAPVTAIDIIVNGQVSKHVDLASEVGRGKWIEVQHTVSRIESCWIAARAWSTTLSGQPDAEAHTNPVYIDINGKRTYRQPSVDRWIGKIDDQIMIHTKRDFKAKASVLAYFQRARDTLLRIRTDKGLSSAQIPWLLSDSKNQIKDKPAESVQFSEKLIGSEVSDADLREFLKPVPPKSPEEALKTFEIADGFRLELVASEPIVVDPAAAAFDEDGQLYVCELRDYPFKPRKGGEPIGTVRLLRDTNGDGRFDEGHVFADKLLWAAGVAPWMGGVFVAAPPDIWYLKDTDGDHRADIRRRVFTGFGTNNQQAVVNNLKMGLDNWIYGTTAGNGGTVVRVDDVSATPVVVTGRDFRFDPVSERFEAITGTVQFGNSFDDWGNRFTCSESRPLEHIVQPDHYLARNPFLVPPKGVHNIAPGPVPIFRISPVEPWRQVRSSRRIVNNERSAGAAGASHHVIDAAAGVTIYRGAAFSSEFLGQAFVGDGQNNLVHRRKILPNGVTFQSERVDEQSEFLRSSDIWFRPVNFVNAPDGTLYCLDLYREVLESIHIPLDVVKYLDLASGREYGRIYRIAPNGFTVTKSPQLSSASSTQLVDLLKSPHGWWRDTAQRLLLERRATEVTPELRTLITASVFPQATLHALWTLNGLGTLDDQSLRTSLASSHPRIREHAIRLSEPRLNSNSSIANAVVNVVQDSDARVRYQAAFSLGELRSPIAATALTQLAIRDGNDPWMRTAILSSAGEQAARMFNELSHDVAPMRSDFMSPLAHLVGTRNRDDEIPIVLSAIEEWHRARNSSEIDLILIELMRGVRRSGRNLSVDLKSNMFLSKQMQSAQNNSIDTARSSTERITAIELLGCMPSDASRASLLELISPEQPEAIQIAALSACSSDNSDEVGRELVSRWRSFTAEVRRAALDIMLSREDRIRVLLETAINSKLSLSDVEPNRRNMLLTHRNEAIRKLASQGFSSASSQSRQDVLRDYQTALKLSGNVAEGKIVFNKTCFQCHQIGGVGYAIGPSLTSVGHAPETLLLHILDPNQFVLPNYIQYSILDKNGQVSTGQIASQTSTSITLRKDRDQTVTVLRSEIDELVSTGKSLMPEELETVISHQSMADLLAFLQASATKGSLEPVAVRDFGTLPGLIEPVRTDATSK